MKTAIFNLKNNRENLLAKFLTPRFVHHVYPCQRSKFNPCGSPAPDSPEQNAARAPPRGVGQSIGDKEGKTRSTGFFKTHFIGKSLAVFLTA